jgi:hypothetical protein
MGATSCWASTTSSELHNGRVTPEHPLEVTRLEYWQECFDGPGLG